MISKEQVRITDITVHINGKAYAIPIERCEDGADMNLKSQLRMLDFEQKKKILKPVARKIAEQTGDRFRIAE